MSDRPMRLKYLTKMKIILCIFLLCITAVSVFGQSVELNGILGKSIEFPAAVKIDGSLRYSGAPIGEVTGGRFTRTRDEKFSGRLRWDSSTGLFSLSELRLEDSGEYKVQNTHQNINTTFQLNVYKGNVPVSKPHLRVTHNEYRCTVLCAAVRGTGATLTLYREGETNPYVTSPVRSHPDLDMTVPVESGTYTCEAKNSVSRNTSEPLTVGDHCTAPAGPSAGTIAVITIAVVAGIIAAVAFLFAVVFALKYRNEQAVLRDVKHLLQKVVLLANDENKVEVPPIAVRSLIKVIELLSIGPPHGENSSAFIQYDTGSKSQDQGNIKVKPPSPDCTKRKMRVKDEQPLFRDVCGIIFGSKTMTSSCPTEFLLNQATPEVGTASAPAGGNH